MDEEYSRKSINAKLSEICRLSVLSLLNPNPGSIGFSWPSQSKIDCPKRKN